MPDTADIAALQRAIEQRYRVGSRHLGSVDVRTIRPVPLPWSGIVSVFELAGHPQATMAYAWRSDDGGIAVVLAMPPVTNAADAVREWLAAK